MPGNPFRERARNRLATVAAKREEKCAETILALLQREAEDRAADRQSEREHRRATTPKPLRNPHLGTHLSLPTTRSLMANPPLAPKIMRFCVPANTGERAVSPRRISAKLTEVQSLAVTSDLGSEPLVSVPAAAPP